jgi:hypothetical protein
MIKRYRSAGLVFVCLLILCARVSAEETAALGTVQLKGTESLIQNLLLICDKSSLRYTFTGGGEKGIKTLELFSGDKIINYMDCNGEKQCRLAGATPVSALPSTIVTASVTGSDGHEEKEKIKLNVLGDETKVYMISSVPELAETTPIVIAGNPSDIKTPAVMDVPAKAPEIKNVIKANLAKGPTIETNVKQNAYNEFILNIVSKDDAGVDFIEILENGVFMDVQICDQKTTCTFTKTIKNRKPGEYKYLIKSMNIKEGLTFQEEKISFLE